MRRARAMPAFSLGLHQSPSSFLRPSLCAPNFFLLHAQSLPLITEYMRMPPDHFFGYGIDNSSSVNDFSSSAITAWRTNMKEQVPSSFFSSSASFWSIASMTLKVSSIKLCRIDLCVCSWSHGQSFLSRLTILYKFL